MAISEGKMGGAAATAIVAAIVGLVVGYGVSAVVSKSKIESQVGEARKETLLVKEEANKKEALLKQEAMKKVEDQALLKRTDTKAADLRVLLNSLERQHANLALASMRGAFDGRKKDTEASAKSLEANSIALSKALGGYYGADFEKSFLEIWRGHIGFMNDYALAAKKGDKDGMEKSVQSLGGFADSVSELLSKANSNLKGEDVKSLVSEYLDRMKGAVDAYGSGDYAKSYEEQALADKQSGQIADVISGAILKQYPDKF